MCGIFGYVLQSSQDLRTPNLQDAIGALAHRGPDDRGTFATVAGSQAVGFAHTRLAIIDLSPGGHQPMVRHDRLVVTYNGEIYNFRDLKDELEAAGESFASSSDTEVLLAAYDRWGASCVDRLRGMFAFAIWDGRQRSLFLARDRLGKKPLYYVERSDGIVFSSEVRALLATGTVAPRLSPAAITSYLRFGSVREPDVIVRGVRMLGAGCTLEYAAGRSTINRYWTVPLCPPELDIPRPRLVGELRELLLESARLRLVADVPVGIFLSSGVDSAAVTALVSQVSAAPVRTFTVGFDAAQSEAQAAAKVARRFGCDHTEARIASTEIASQVDPSLAAMDQPSIDGLNTFIVSRAARQAGLVVAFSGVGGDETFAGYPVFRRIRRLYAIGRLARPLGAIRALSGLTASPTMPIPLRKALAILTAGGRLESTYAETRAVFTEAQCGRLLHANLAPSLQSPSALFDTDLDARLASGELDLLGALTALELSSYLRDTLLRDADVMSMAHSLEVRAPLLDHRLIERIMRVPGAEKLCGVGNKALLGEAVPEIPMDSRTAPKRGFDLPYDTWLRGPLRSWARERLDGCGRRVAEVLNLDATSRILAAFDRHSRGVTWSRVWSLAVLSDWCERHQATL